MVVMNVSEREASICLEKSNVIAAVAILYGDEIARQKYRK